MRRRKTQPPLLTVRVSHEASRLERHCMADAFERLLPILTRRLRPGPAQRASPRQAAPDRAGLTRREWI
jgi:hypothetical protein